MVFGWFHHGVILVLGGLILVLGGFIKVFLCHPGLGFFSTDHDTHRQLSSFPPRQLSFVILSRRWACLQACCFPDSTGSDGEKKQARLFIRVQLRLCAVACFLCLACMLCAPLPSTMLPATRHPKNKEVHSCRARPFAMQRTSTGNIARVLGGARWARLPEVRAQFNVGLFCQPMEVHGSITWRCGQILDGIHIGWLGHGKHLCMVAECAWIEVHRSPCVVSLHSNFE